MSEILSPLYIAARESLLKSFEIKSIVRLASKTFGETQTNTIILFLKKYDEPPKRSDLLLDSISAIFSFANIGDWEDSDIFNGYIDKINVDKADYFKFISEETAWDSFNKNSYFMMYVKEFLKQSFIKTKENQAGFKRLTDAEKHEWKNKAFYRWVKEIEKEKMFYYALIYNQMTLVVTAPKDKKKQVKFLGYDWSKRKGQEGIKPLKNGGYLYSDTARDASDKISTLIKAMYSNELLNIQLLEGYYSYANLHEMFDFDKVNFSKAINTNVNRKIKIDSKYKIKRLGECCEKPAYGASVSAVEGNPDTDYRYIRITDISDYGFLNDRWMTAEDIEEQYILKNGDFLFARTGATAGKTYLYKESAGKSIYAGYLIRFRTKPELLPEYLDIYTRTHYYLDWVDDYKKVNERPSLNANIFSDVLLPIPPTNIQEKIIDECHPFDCEYTELHEKIKESHARISKLFAEAQIKASNGYKLSSEDDFNLGIGKRVIQSELNEQGKLKVFSANVIESVGNIDKEGVLSDYDKPSVLWGIDGDWMVSYLEKNIPFYPTDHCGFIRIMNSEINPEYMAMVLDTEGAKAGFDRTNRASIERISALTLKMPDKDLQDDVITKCKAYKKDISDAKAKIKTVLKKKEGIFESYIKFND